MSARERATRGDVRDEVIDLHGDRSHSHGIATILGDHIERKVEGLRRSAPSRDEDLDAIRHTGDDLRSMSRAQHRCVVRNNLALSQRPNARTGRLPSQTRKARR